MGHFTTPVTRFSVEGWVPDTSTVSASLTGVVRNGSGSVVADLSVTLSRGSDGLRFVTKTNPNGEFVFFGLSPGLYLVKLEDRSGSNTLISAEIELKAGEKRKLQVVGNRFLTTSTTVQVTATQGEVAQAQIQQQVKQRAFGVLPNFYSSYLWDAAPLSPKLKFQLTARSTLDPVSFLVAGGLAAAEQRHGTFPGYGQGAKGYAKRFGAAYADATVSKLMSRAVLPSMLHQDPRYFYRGSGTVGSRALYALAASVMCRGDNGTLQPNYSQILGNFAASGISNLYRAPADRTVSLTLRNGLIMMASGAAENLLREFLLKKITSNVPAFANGKP